MFSYRVWRRMQYIQVRKLGLLLLGTAAVYYYIQWLLTDAFNWFASLLQTYLGILWPWPLADGHGIGWWGAYISVILIIGIVARALTAPAAAVVVLALTFGLVTRGPVNYVPNAQGVLVPVTSPEMRQLGASIALSLGWVVAFVILLHLFHLGAFGVGGLIIGVGTHAAGIHVHKAHQLGWHPWAVLGGIAAVLVVLHDVVGIRSYSDLSATVAHPQVVQGQLLLVLGLSAFVALMVKLVTKRINLLGAIAIAVMIVCGVSLLAIDPTFSGPNAATRFANESPAGGILLMLLLAFGGGIWALNKRRG